MEASIGKGWAINRTQRTRQQDWKSYDRNIGGPKRDYSGLGEGEQRAAGFQGAIVPIEVLFLVDIMRASVVNFSQLLVEEAQKSSVDGETRNLGDILHSIMPLASFARPQNLVYGVTAYVNNILFQDFDKVCNSTHNLEMPLLTFWTRSAIDPQHRAYDPEFHLFFQEKLELCRTELGLASHWPKHLIAALLDTTKQVWLISRIIFRSMGHAPTLFRVQRLVPFNQDTMDAKPYELDLEDEDASTGDKMFVNKVGFMIAPGFEMNGKVIRSQIYLEPKFPIAFGDM